MQPDKDSKPAAVSLNFRIYRGEQLVRTEHLSEAVIKLGKLPSSHLCIEDEGVSRMHAVIESSESGEVSIIDLGSASGTVVNGNRVNKAPLRSGDEITVGTTRIVVEFGGEGVSAVREQAAAQQAAPPVPAAPPPMAPPVGAPPLTGGAVPVPGAAAGAAGAGFTLGGAVGSPVLPASEPPAGADENVQYGIVATGPPVPADEVDAPESAVEVVVLWGARNVLQVSHLSPPRSFYVGEPTPGSKGQGDIDYLVGSDVLGTDRLPVVSVVSGSVSVVIPSGATGSVTVAGAQTSFEQLAGAGQLRPSSELPGASEYPLPPESSARVEYKGFTFIVRPVHAGKVVGGGFTIDWRPLLYVAGALLVHVVFLMLFYFLPPASSSLSLDELNADARWVKVMMDAKELEEPEPEETQDTGEDAGGQGERHKGDEGQMGKEDSAKTKNRYAIKGDKDNKNPQMARDQAIEQARTVGALGVLGQVMGVFDAPTSPFGGDVSYGQDEMNALGALMGAQPGENLGFGGLGMRGTGRGGGGHGEGTIGLGNIGTIGHGGGGGTGSGYGRGAGHLSGRKARVPRIRQGTASVRGQLSKEVIRRVIRRHINEVKFCYEQQLNQSPDLDGRVVISFIISASGAVQSSNVGSSSLGSRPVETCIASAVRRWTFPAPDGGGLVVVNYPFVLSPSGG